MGQTIELPRTRDPGSGLGGEWRVIVRNDDHNTFDHVAHTLARYVPGITVDVGYAIGDVGAIPNLHGHVGIGLVPEPFDVRGVIARAG